MSAITTPALNVVKKKTTQVTGKKVFALREQRSAQFKKKARVKPNLPAVGERKALRKRIVLSSTNALPVSSMQDLSQDNIGNEEFQSKMLGIPDEMLDQLRAVDAFKTSQNWSLFRRPGTLTRKETVVLGNMVKDVNGTPGVQRMILDGPKLSGKSILLLQAMSMGFLNDWVVINIPEGQDLTIAHSSYHPLSSQADGPQLYTQPDLTAALLTRISRSNKKVLSKLNLKHEHPEFPEPLQKNISLDRLAERGASNPSIAPTVFDALWKELTVPTAEDSKLPPLLVSIDSLNHLMTETAYRDADYKPIHAHQFGLVRHFLSLLFNKPEATFGPAGGIVLGATSGSNVPGNYALDVALRQLSARTATPLISADSPEFPLPDPYHRVDKRVVDIFNTGNDSSLQLRLVNGLSKAEAKGYLEYFAQSGLLREKITDDLVTEKWSLSASGLVGFVEQAAVRVRT